MAVDRYEKQFPKIPNCSLDASDLGFAYPLVHSTVITALGERFPVGAVNSYVVFVTDPSVNQMDIRYDWTLNKCDSDWNVVNDDYDGYPQTLSSTFGRVQWRPVEAGNYRLVVNVYTNDNFVSDTVEISCTVYSKADDVQMKEFELLRRGIPEKVCFTGDMDTARRIIFDFGLGVESYFEAGVALSGGAIPRKYLASIAYTALLTWIDDNYHPAYEPLRGKNIQKWTDGTIRELAAPIYLAEAMSAEARIGLCRIIPMHAAVALGLIRGPAERATGKKRRVRAEKALKNVFDTEISDEVKVALYNFLRFPKSNILIAALTLRFYLENWPVDVQFPDHPPDIQGCMAHRQFLSMLYLFGGALLAPHRFVKKKISYTIWSGFAKNVAANYWLPAFDIFLLSDDSKLSGYRQEWTDWSGKDKTYQPSQGPQGKKIRSRALAVHFDGGFAQYLFLRRSYDEKLKERYAAEYGSNSVHNIDNPMKWLAEYIHDLKPGFSPLTISVHADLVAPLREANAKINTALGNDYKVNNIGGFNPRMIGGTRYKDWSISYHSLGRAIDIDWNGNPQIFSQTMNDIKEQLGLRKDYEIDWKTATLDEMKWANNLWETVALDIFEEGEAMVLSGAFKTPLVHCGILVGNFGKVWDRVGKKGRFLDMSVDIISAMTDNGFEWGGYWHGQKDFMHFQIK